MTRPRGAFDFETYEWVNPYAFALMWGQYGERESLFDSIRASNDKRSPGDLARDCLLAMKLTAESGGPIEWWAHNGGKYDTLFLLAAAQRMGWVVSANVSGVGRVVTATFRAPDSKTTLHIRDSYCVVQSSLKAAVNDFECEAKKTFTEDDYSVDVRQWEFSRLKAGCLQDCECVLQLLDKVETLAEQWGGKLKATFSSMAFGILKSEVDWPSHEGIQNINEWCRVSYLGGRVEVFRHKPSQWLTEFDRNSSYPASLAGKLPWEFSHTEDRPSAIGKLQDSADFEAIIEATVNVPANVYLPVLPYRPEEGGVYFPVGRWRGRFAKTELAYAQTQGAEVLKLHNAAVYKSSAPLAKFVNRLYETKSHAKGALREFCKLSLNGSYGKAGQKPERERLMLFDSLEEAYAIAFDRKTKRLDVNNPLLLTVFEHRWPKQTHYALASYITANSRIALHSALAKSCGIAYCDTDSVHAVTFPEAAFEGSRLGEWKCEIQRLRGEYFAPKIYRLKHEGKVTVAAKGFHIKPRNKTPEELQRVAALFDAIVAGDAIPQSGMRGARGQLRNGNVPEYRTLQKKWHGVSSKRRQLNDSEGDTCPWSVAELEAGLHQKQRKARE